MIKRLFNFVKSGADNGFLCKKTWKKLLGGLQCPKCGMTLDEKGFLSETGIFTCGMGLVCECGCDFSIRAKTLFVTWDITPNQKESAEAIRRALDVGVLMINTKGERMNAKEVRRIVC